MLLVQMDDGESRQAVLAIATAKHLHTHRREMKKLAYILSAAVLSFAWMYGFMTAIKFLFDV